MHLSEGSQHKTSINARFHSNSSKAGKTDLRNYKSRAAYSWREDGYKIKWFREALGF
jgi:hypothetical protein